MLRVICQVSPRDRRPRMERPLPRGTPIPDRELTPRVQPGMRSPSLKQRALALGVHPDSLSRAEKRQQRQRRSHDVVSKGERTKRAIYEYLQQLGEGPLNCSAVARHFGLNNGTVNRYIAALRSEGLLSVAHDRNASGRVKLYMSFPHTNHLGNREQRRHDRRQKRAVSHYKRAEDRRRANRRGKALFFRPSESENTEKLPPPRLAIPRSSRSGVIYACEAEFCLRRFPHFGCGRPEHDERWAGSRVRRPIHRRSVRRSAKHGTKGGLVHGTQLEFETWHGSTVDPEALTALRRRLEPLRSAKPRRRPARWYADPGREEAIELQRRL